MFLPTAALRSVSSVRMPSLARLARRRSLTRAEVQHASAHTKRALRYDVFVLLSPPCAVGSLGSFCSFFDALAVALLRDVLWPSIIYRCCFLCYSSAVPVTYSLARNSVMEAVGPHRSAIDLLIAIALLIRFQKEAPFPAPANTSAARGRVSLRSRR